MEKLLMVWINEKQLARLLYSDIREIPLVLVLKNLRLVKGGLTILKREQRFTVWLDMEKLPVQIKMLPKNLWKSLKTLWIERDLFTNKYSIVTRQASSGKNAKKDLHHKRREG